jgi:hypothetical protein
MMMRLNEVVLDWGDGRDVVVTVHVRPHGRPADGPDLRLAELIASAIWAAAQLAELAPTPEQ